MSQLLVVAGGTSPQRAVVYERLKLLYERLCGVKPSSEARLKHHDAAQFGRPRGDSTPVVRAADGQGWAVCAGTWFFRGRAGTAGLEALCAELAGGASLDGLLAEMDGFFGLVVPGDEPGTTRAATDRLGILHLYEARVDGCLALSTSSLALAAALDAAWDRTGAREYVALGNVFEERTLFEGVRKLPPATCLDYDATGAVKARQWWREAEVSWDRAACEGTVEEMAEALRQGMRMVESNFPNPLLDLTGGFDSRALYGAALGAGLTFSTMVAGPADNPDVVCARRIARTFGTESRHLELSITPVDVWIPRLRRALAYCDGECEMFPYARVLDAHDRLWPDYTVSVNGSAGGITKGLWWELLAPHIGQSGHFDARKVAGRRFATRPEPARLWAQPFTDSLVDHFTGVIERVNKGFEKSRNTAMMDNTYLAIRLHRWMGRTASSTVRLWDCVTPFALRRPLETMLAAPAALRRNFRMARRLIEHQDPRLAALPVAEGYPAAPMRWNNIHRFWPMAVEQWGRVQRRLGRHLGAAASSQPPHEIWREEESRSLLDPARMRTAFLYDSSTLAAILSASRHEGFANRTLLERMIGLEVLAEGLHRARKEIV